MEIRQNMGHYELFVRGTFAGSFDTFCEAVRAYEEMVREDEKV